MKKVFIDELMDKVEFYDSNLKRFSDDKQQINPKLRLDSILKIVKTLNIEPDSIIVDVGTGYGYGAVILRSLGCTVLGVESNKDKLYEGMNYWKTLGVEFKEITNAVDLFSSDGLYFLARNASHLTELPDSSVDLITSFYLSGYMIRKNGAYNSCSRILKKSSRLIITTQGHDVLPKMIRRPFVQLLGRYWRLNGLDYKGLFAADKTVHDRFILTYNK
jgi:SAM-dependent methyltransferase